jgi:cytochrome c553
MSEIGRRFEQAGRAAVAGRFELATYQIGEIGELFEDDLARAEVPKEGHPEVVPSFRVAFAGSQPAALTKAASAKDLAAFKAAFAQAAETCNACHKASGHGFIEVPTLAGKAVPSLDPVGDASAKGHD